MVDFLGRPGHYRSHLLFRGLACRPLFVESDGIGSHVPLLSEELGLTDDQRAALKDLIRNHRDEIQPLVKAVIVKKRALQELVLGENPDPATIRHASADLGNAIAEAAVLGSSLTQKAESILTPEQLTWLREMRQNRRKAFDESLQEWQERNPAF